MRTDWRLCSTTLVRGVSVELEAENWPLCSTSVVRGGVISRCCESSLAAHLSLAAESALAIVISRG